MRIAIALVALNTVDMTVLTVVIYHLTPLTKALTIFTTPVFNAFQTQIAVALIPFHKADKTFLMLV